jgi:hypothetical protein
MRAEIDDDDVQAETTAAIAWMRERGRAPPRYAERAARSGSRNFGGVRTQPAGTR